MNDISSPKCFELFERFSPVGSSLKTFAGCLVSNLAGYSPRLSHHWKAKVSKSSHFVFLLQPSRPLTDEIGSGLLGGPGFSKTPFLGTPTNRVVERSPETIEKSRAFRESQGEWKTVPLYLAEQIAMIPSPRTRGLLGGSGSKQMMQDQINSGVISVEDASGLMGIQMSPSQLKRNSLNPAQTIQTLPTAQEAVLLGTPKAQDSRAALTDRGKSNMGEQVQEYLSGTNPGLRLQPAFVEWMMGYPIGHTDLKPSATA